MPRSRLRHPEEAMRDRRFFLWSLGYGCGLAASLRGITSAPASVVRPMTMDEIIAAATVVFVGRVVKSEAAWADPRHSRVVTRCTFTVQQPPLLPGFAPGGRSVTLTFWGGSLDGETQGIAGARIPKPGERYVVLLGPEARGTTEKPLDGLKNGFFPIILDTRSGLQLVTAGEAGPLVLTSDGRIVTSAEAAGAPTTRSVTIEQFTRWLRQNVARIKAAHRSRGGR